MCVVGGWVVRPWWRTPARLEWRIWKNKTIFYVIVWPLSAQVSLRAQLFSLKALRPPDTIS